MLPSAAKIAASVAARASSTGAGARALSAASASASSAAAAAGAASSPVKLTLPALPYGYNALEPVLSAELMELHHSKHHAACESVRSFFRVVGSH